MHSPLLSLHNSTLTLHLFPKPSIVTCTNCFCCEILTLCPHALASCFHNHLLLHGTVFVSSYYSTCQNFRFLFVFDACVQLDVHVFACKCDLVVALTAFFLPPFLLYVACVLYVSITVVQSYTEKHHEFNLLSSVLLGVLLGVVTMPKVTKEWFYFSIACWDYYGDNDFIIWTFNFFACSDAACVTCSTGMDSWMTCSTNTDSRVTCFKKMLFF